MPVLESYSVYGPIFCMIFEEGVMWYDCKEGRLTAYRCIEDQISISAVGGWLITRYEAVKG